VPVFASGYDGHPHFHGLNPPKLRRRRVMQLDPAAIRAGVRLEAHAALGSTNEAALARARAGEGGPLWITASRQTAGRGRRGRAWVSEPGNLYATLLLTDPSPPHRAAELSFVAALAVHDAMVALVASAAPAVAPRVAIKWPNDVLIDGAKSAGILIEGEGASGGVVAVAAGIGVNCAHHPRDLEFAATDLAALGLAVDPEGLFRVLSRTMLDRLAQWDRGNGFPATRSDWLQRAAGLGGNVRVLFGARELEGRFETLNAAGCLVLRLDDGTTQAIATGDVFPLQPSTAPRTPPSSLAGERGEVADISRCPAPMDHVSSTAKPA
jgi:BirA family transcriptional regulator, biotin operon repressor / biotin---[acetyl-CoA-carboxylase] ligase